MQNEVYYILQYKRNPIWYWVGIPECLMYTIQPEEAKRYSDIDEIKHDIKLEHPLEYYDIIKVTVEKNLIDLSKIATQKLEDETI